MDEHWLFILIHHILKKDFNDFFIKMDDCKTYQNPVHLNAIPNKEEYQQYSRKHYQKKLDWRFLAKNHVVPYIYTTQKYLNVKDQLSKKGYWFMRKVCGTREEYLKLKSDTLILSKDSLSDDFMY
jgi:hypothetical protein